MLDREGPRAGRIALTLGLLDATVLASQGAFCRFALVRHGDRRRISVVVQLRRLRVVWRLWKLVASTAEDWAAGDGPS